MSWQRLGSVVSKTCGLVLVVAAMFSLLRLPADAAVWSRCLREQRCAELLPRAIPPLDAAAAWTWPLLALGVALLLPGRWWRALGGVAFRHRADALQIRFDPAANAQVDASGAVVGCTISLHNTGRRRVSGLTVLFTAWSIEGSPGESDKVILASLRRRALVPSDGGAARAQYSLGRHQRLDFHVASVREDRPGYRFIFGDAVGDSDTRAAADVSAGVLPVPGGRYRVLIHAEGRWAPPVERYFLLTLERNGIAMVELDED